MALTTTTTLDFVVDMIEVTPRCLSTRLTACFRLPNYSNKGNDRIFDRILKVTTSVADFDSAALLTSQFLCLSFEIKIAQPDGADRRRG